jgi:hypothetical protein
VNGQRVTVLYAAEIDWRGGVAARAGERPGNFFAGRSRCCALAGLVLDTVGLGVNTVALAAGADAVLRKCKAR